MDNMEANGLCPNLFKALANEQRIKIINTISLKEKNVGDIVKATALSQSAVSQHLSRLRRCGLVNARRSAQTIYYTLNKEAVRPIMTYLSGLQKEERYEQ